MTVLLLSCLNNLLGQTNNSNSSTGNQILYNWDTSIISIDIKYIKFANEKLIERLYLIEIDKQKDSIINLKDFYINNQNIIIKGFQKKIQYSNDVNYKLNENIINLHKDIVKQKRRKNIWKYITIIGGGAIGTYLILK